MPNTAFSNRKLAVVFSSEFMAQAAFDTPIATADLDARHPQTTPAFHAIVPFREETRDCTGEFITIENITGKIARFTFAFDLTAKLGAGWFAYLQGVAAAPTGTPADEVQSLDLGGATGGDYVLAFDFEGLSGETAAIPFDATNAEIQAALEAVRPIKTGNVVVAGTAPKSVTFQGNLAKANLPLITVADDNTTGGTGVVVTQTTPGANKLHAITRTTTERPPLFSLIEAFDDGSGDVLLYKNLVLNDWTVTANRRGKVTLTVTAFGDPIPTPVTGFSIPACVTQAPVRTKDVRVKIGSDWITDDLREVTYTESNNIDVSEDALRFDDITPDQLERGDRTASINLLSLGSPTSDMYEFAADEDNAFAALELHIGRPGERHTVYAPNTQFRLDDGLIEFVGARNKSAFRLIGRPSPDNSNVVTRGEYHGAFTGTFLLTS